MAVVIGSSMTSLVSCIDETTPEGGTVTSEMLLSSAKATEALLWGMPAKLFAYNEAVGSYHYDWGYGSVAHIRDVMTEEYVVTTHGYDWYDAWEYNYYLGENYLSQQLIWQTYYKQILPTNIMIETLAGKDLNDAQQGFLASAYAFRAFHYLDLARMFEFLPNDGTSAVNSNGNNVQGLTVPKVIETTTEEEARNNPRLTHYQMFDFIMSDLKTAAENIAKLPVSDKVVPTEAAVYGIMARAYLWHASFRAEADANGGAAFCPCDTVGGYENSLTAKESFELAKSCAQHVIDLNKYAPLSKDQWLDTKSGFNDMSVKSWIMAISIPTEADCVHSGIVNWTSWCSNEASYGYASAGPFVKMGKAFYDRVNDTDFRKLSYKAPAGSPLAGKEPRLVDEATYAGLPDYSSFKFRPGEGNTEDYTVGSACDIPLMRVEEMHYIIAECEAQLDNVSDAVQRLEDFVTTYRDPAYKCPSGNKDGVIDEIFFQKRLELWGEGVNLFDYKRLNKPVTRVYEGTNFGEDAQINTTTRPAWMNFVVVRNEGANNAAMKMWNNPDPSDCYPKGASGTKVRTEGAPSHMKLFFVRK